MDGLLRIHARDNVAVAVQPGLSAPEGHKVALESIKKGSRIVKYGFPIGVATEDIDAGAWVHTHNMATLLSGHELYAYTPETPDRAMEPVGHTSFMGYARHDGQAGTRNEIWVIPTVGCVSVTAQLIAREAQARFGHMVDGVCALTHPYGCGQTGEDLERTKHALAAMARHPNAGGVLLLGLGCEGTRLDDILPRCAGYNVEAFNAQDVEDEVEHALTCIERLVKRAAQQRTPIPLSKLVLGLKCGGSDGYSGLTANPLLGRITERFCASGASALMTEVPEMFGAESILMNHAADEAVFGGIVRMINSYKDYFAEYKQPIHDNPSPGNKDGGISTLEDKSLGCTQKCGGVPVADVLDYAAPRAKDGLSLVWGPGYDLCACTALALAGANIILFTTGRGTPYGGPVPTLKVSTNAALFKRKRNWMDFDAAPVLNGGMDACADTLIQLIMDTANGAPAVTERFGYKEMALFKTGVVE